MASEWARKKIGVIAADLDEARREGAERDKYIGSSEQDAARDNELATLRKRVEELEAALKEEGGWKAEAHRMFERTEKAERERDEFASKAVEMELLWSGTNAELEDAKADLDAALRCLDGTKSTLLFAAMHGVQAGGEEADWEHIKDLLEKRREQRG